MNTIIGDLGKNQKFIELLKSIENKTSPIEISGLTDVSETSILAGIKEFSKRPIIIITYNEIQAKRIVENIKYFTDAVYLLPKKEILVYDYIAESKNLPYERIDALNKINIDSSYTNRSKIAKLNNIKNYQGTASQNIEMLNLLKKSILKY